MENFLFKFYFFIKKVNKSLQSEDVQNDLQGTYWHMNVNILQTRHLQVFIYFNFHVDFQANNWLSFGNRVILFLLSLLFYWIHEKVVNYTTNKMICFKCLKIRVARWVSFKVISLCLDNLGTDIQLESFVVQSDRVDYLLLGFSS